jgi:hypothetical protein
MMPTNICTLADIAEMLDAMEMTWRKFLELWADDPAFPAPMRHDWAAPPEWWVRDINRYCDTLMGRKEAAHGSDAD